MHTYLGLIVQVIRNAKLWCDVESAEEAEQLSDLWEWTLVPGFTASKILWLKNKEPENFARLQQVLLPHDFFNYHLTGRYVMEVAPPLFRHSNVSQLGCYAWISMHRTFRAEDSIIIVDPRVSGSRLTF